MSVDRDDPMVRSYIEAGAPYSKDPEPDRVIAWLRKYISTLATDAAIEALGDGEPFCVPDLVQLGPDICRRMDWPEAWGQRAVLREFTAAKERVAKFIDQATREVRTLAFERAPGPQMIRSVQMLADRHGLSGTQAELNSFIIPFCQRIAAGTLSRGRNVRG